jgi:WD40 repeat protein
VNGLQKFKYDIPIYSSPSPVKKIHYDPPTNSIIPIHTIMPYVTCISLNTKEIAYTLKNDRKSNINICQWEKNIQHKTQKDQLIIMTGCSLGKICVFVIDQSVYSSTANAPIISARLSINAHASGISQLKFDGFKIVSASLDQDIKVFDTISGRLVRSLVVKNMRRSSVHVLFSFFLSVHKNKRSIQQWI